jgi:4-alpha-glucanotransferase
MKGRGNGLLLHLTSLPSPFGIGDLGPWAYKFIDFLAEAKQSYWQILPLNPTDLGHGNSPYHSASAFAGNPLLISPELLFQDGLLNQEDLSGQGKFSEARVDYLEATSFKGRLFHRAFEHFKTSEENHDYEEFRAQNAHWLDDYALFMALKGHFRGEVWSEWPEALRERNPDDLESMGRALQDAIEKEAFLQYLFFKQWHMLKDYCNEKDVKIIGDMPIYMVHDSADLWVHPDLCKLDDKRRPLAVAGVPPDYFSETGQLWGNPVYRWDVLKERGYDWWIQRLEHGFTLFDFVRIDHFRGLVSYWEVEANEKNAINGKWVEAPAEDFFRVISDRFPEAPIIAEDLGLITPDVWEVMDHFGFPGMKVLLFAFGEDLPTNPYAPHNYIKNCVVYTGTHDNNTAKGWFEKEAKQEEKTRLAIYLGREIAAKEVHWELVRLAMMSVANTAIIPMQDILGLGEPARMNRPAKKDGNWRWRLLPDQLTPSLTRRLLEMTQIYGRA